MISIKKKIRPLSWGQGWLRPQRSFTGCGEGMIMQSLKRSLRFRWSSSQMEANLEASDLTAIELPPTYLRAFHSLIALDSSSTFLIREACGHFRRPRKKKLQHSESCAATKQTQALYWLRLPDSFQMWFETTRFVYFVKLKHASRTFFDLKLE